MKRLLLQISGFILTLSLSWSALFLIASQSTTTYSNLIASERDWGGITKRSREWQTTEGLKENLDILFVGSSTCYSGIDPSALKAFGLNGFSFCSSSQVPYVSLEIAETALMESSAQTIVLDLYNWNAESENLESTRDWVLNTSLWSIPWRKTWRSLARSTLDPYTVILSWAYPLIRRFREPGEGVPEDKDGVYRGLGFIGRTYPPLESRPECTEVDITLFQEKTCRLFQKMTSKFPEKRIIVVMPPLLCPLEIKRPQCIPESSWIMGQGWPGADSFENYYDDHHQVESGALNYSEWLAHQIFDRCSN